jgi:hypothetical protein
MGNECYSSGDSPLHLSIQDSVEIYRRNCIFWGFLSLSLSHSHARPCVLEDPNPSLSPLCWLVSGDKKDFMLLKDSYWPVDFGRTFMCKDRLYCLWGHVFGFWTYFSWSRLLEFQTWKEHVGRRSGRWLYVPLSISMKYKLNVSSMEQENKMGNLKKGI